MKETYAWKLHRNEFYHYDEHVFKSNSLQISSWKINMKIKNLHCLTSSLNQNSPRKWKCVYSPFLCVEKNNNLVRLSDGQNIRLWIFTSNKLLFCKLKREDSNNIMLVIAIYVWRYGKTRDSLLSLFHAVLLWWCVQEMTVEYYL